MSRLLFFLVVLTLSPVGAVSSAWAQTAAEPELQKLDALYRYRDTPERVQEIDGIVAALEKQPSLSFDALWRIARWRCWQADGLPHGSAERGRFGSQCWKAAERASELKPQAVEGHYWASMGIGQYALAVGVLTALREGLEEKINHHLDAAIRADLNFQFRAALVIRARALYELPWPKRDLKKSEAILTQTVQKFPMNLRAWLFLAETQLRAGNPEAARQSLQHVFDGSVDYDPPEARRSKGMAKWVQAQIEKELK